jgi:hypothetical protein
VGLLDDAIREHLDLKRRRGADPAEIERAEREALGPVRRNGMTDDPESAGAELDPALGSARDEPDEGTASDLVEESSREQEPEYAAAGTDLYEDEASFAGPEDAESFAEHAEPLTEETVVEPPAEDDDPHRTQVMRTVDLPEADDATAEHEVEEGYAADDDLEHPREDSRNGEQTDEGEDVLEETPEFLQDTPDHDRLWFEQRPPRDFDFDG